MVCIRSCDNYITTTLCPMGNYIFGADLAYYICMYIISIQVSLVYGTTTRQVLPRDLVGIKALEIQLPSEQVYVPNLPNMRDSSVGALLYFNRGTYRFPDYHSALVRHLITADTLCADKFVEAMGRKLCLPTSRIDLSNREEILFTEVRNRYRLSQRFALMYPPADKCYVCKCQMDHSDFQVTTVECCQMPFHRQCINGRRKCPYCKTPWVFLNCCVCKKECVPLRQQWFDYYAAHYLSRMSCCAADVHDECRHKIKDNCPACHFCIESGCPVEPKTMEEVCRQRFNCRMTERKRKELVGAGWWILYWVWIFTNWLTFIHSLEFHLVGSFPSFCFIGFPVWSGIFLYHHSFNHACRYSFTSTYLCM